MKKFLVVLCISITAISCGSGSETKEPPKEAAATEEKSEDYKKGLALVAQSDCLTCHKVLEPAIGPAYQAVADRYENTEAVIDTLAGKIISGGAGRWGTTPMSAHPQLSQDDAKSMVKYVMSLKK